MRRVTAAIAALSLAMPAQAAPAIWKVADADSSVWLFGSVHMLQADMDWRTATQNKIMSKVDRVYFEADVSAEAQAQIVTATVAAGFYSGGVLLSDEIDGELIDRLRDAASDYGIPMPALLTMKPWMAAMTISAGPLAGAGYEASNGVEAVLSAELPREKTGFLETGEEQIEFLAGGTLDEQITMLEATLDTLDMAERDLADMVSAWLAGDPEGLGEAFDAQLTGFGVGLTDRIIDLRNHDWTDKIAVMLDANETALIVIGAAHLAGDVSVVRLLEERGFASERVQ